MLDGQDDGGHGKNERSRQPTTQHRKAAAAAEMMEEEKVKEEEDKDSNTLMYTDTLHTSFFSYTLRI